jgi:cell division protein FtsX
VYALREAFRQVLRHPTASLATFFTALVSFALLYFLGLLLWNLEKVVQSLERELEVAAFLKDGANVEALLTEIQCLARGGGGAPGDQRRGPGPAGPGLPLPGRGR